MTQSTHASQPAPALAPADVDRLADEIAEVASHIDAAEHRLLTLIRRFDDGSGWATHGALSCAHWLNWRIGLDLGAARERVRVARALGGLPLVDDALRLRDDGCRFPGCTNRRTDAHHVVHWTRGGATSLANLCSLCRRHHRLVHEHGYRVVIERDGALRFIRGDGSPVPLADEDLRVQRRSLARSAGDAHDGAVALCVAHAPLGLDIDAATAAPRWSGEPVDYGLAVQALLADGPVG